MYTQSIAVYCLQPAKRRKVDPIPVVHSSSSKLTVKLSSRLMAMLEEKPLPFVQIQNIETLLKNPDRVEVSSWKSFVCQKVVTRTVWTVILRRIMFYTICRNTLHEHLIKIFDSVEATGTKSGANLDILSQTGRKTYFV